MGFAVAADRPGGVSTRVGHSAPKPLCGQGRSLVLRLQMPGLLGQRCDAGVSPRAPPETPRRSWRLGGDARCSPSTPCPGGGTRAGAGHGPRGVGCAAVPRGFWGWEKCVSFAGGGETFGCCKEPCRNRCDARAEPWWQIVNLLRQAGCWRVLLIISCEASELHRCNALDGEIKPGLSSRASLPAAAAALAAAGPGGKTPRFGASRLGLGPAREPQRLQLACS